MAFPVLPRRIGGRVWKDERGASIQEALFGSAERNFFTPPAFVTKRM
jgi:hypothetical protein